MPLYTFYTDTKKSCERQRAVDSWWPRSQRRRRSRRQRPRCAPPVGVAHSAHCPDRSSSIGRPRLDRPRSVAGRQGAQERKCGGAGDETRTVVALVASGTALVSTIGAGRGGRLRCRCGRPCWPPSTVPVPRVEGPDHRPGAPSIISTTFDLASVGLPAGRVLHLGHRHAATGMTGPGAGRRAVEGERRGHGRLQDPAARVPAHRCPEVQRHRGGRVAQRERRLRHRP